MHSRMYLLKIYIGFITSAILALQASGTEEVIAAAVSENVANGARLSAEAAAFVGNVRRSVEAAGATVNIGANNVALNAFEATEAIASIVSATAISADELTCSVANIVDGVVSRGCGEINRIAKDAGTSALNTLQGGTASITKEVKAALEEINAAAKEAGAEIASILETSIHLMESIQKQSIDSILLAESILAPMASVAEHSNNINRKVISNGLLGRVSHLTHSKPE